jgi:mRNA degradation ribonuclease J1/J2
MPDTNLDTVAVTTLTASGRVTAAGFTNTGTSVVAAATGITAAAGGTQAAATQLASTINRVDTVATAADSVKLPLAVAGAVVYLTNNTATSMQVFGSGTDTINIGAGDVATATGVAQAANKSAIYFCTSAAPAGKWERVLTA